MIIIFPPKSTLFAIELSPKSLHMLTANSVKIDMPVTFNNIFRNSLFILVLSAKAVSRLTIPVSLSTISNIINTPAINDIYTANSGLYCFIIIIIAKDIKPTPKIFIISNFYHMNYS